MLIPAAAIADTTEKLIGTWVGSSEFYTGEVTYFLIRLYEDNDALYETNCVKAYEDEPDGYVMRATWELLDDGLHIRYKNWWDHKKDEDLVLHLTQSEQLAMDLSTSCVIFVKLPDRKKKGTFHIVQNWD